MIMKIALMNEFSQSSKNSIILEELKSVAESLGHTVYNTAMVKPLVEKDVPEAYTEDNPRLTYLHLGIQASLLLNSGAVDFVITGCGTGQGALMSLNAYPGVVCGYCIEPTDAYLFLQINNGNALSIPFAKGFGWGAELNLHNIFEKAFSSPKGNGYPASGKLSQNRNALLLKEIKAALGKDILSGLKSLDQTMVKEALTTRFQQCFFENCKNEELREYAKSTLEA
jgi:ribose 5-phosphate isomerase B